MNKNIKNKVNDRVRTIFPLLLLNLIYFLNIRGENLIPRGMNYLKIHCSGGTCAYMKTIVADYG